MIPLDDARLIVLIACPRRPPLASARQEAIGCVLAEDIVATESVPPFANSSVDGYAVRAADTAVIPVRLRGSASLRPERHRLAPSAPARPSGS